MAHKGTKSTLSAKQRKAAEMLVDPEYSGTITELCKTVGVPRRTFYNWRDNYIFCNYLDDLIAKYTDGELSTVWKALIRECMNGNVTAIRLFFELKGKMSTTQAMTIRIVDDV